MFNRPFIKAENWKLKMRLYKLRFLQFLPRPPPLPRPLPAPGGRPHRVPAVCGHREGQDPLGQGRQHGPALQDVDGLVRQEVLALQALPGTRQKF